MSLGVGFGVSESQARPCWLRPFASFLVAQAGNDPSETVLFAMEIAWSVV